jgi:DNA-binding XRE family transcriptional regulator
MANLYNFKLGNLIIKKDMTQREVADLAGISWAKMSAIVRGQRPRLDDTTKQAIAKALKTETSKIF